MSLQSDVRRLLSRPVHATASHRRFSPTARWRSHGQRSTRPPLSSSPMHRRRFPPAFGRIFAWRSSSQQDRPARSRSFGASALVRPRLTRAGSTIARSLPPCRPSRSLSPQRLSSRRALADREPRRPWCKRINGRHGIGDGKASASACLRWPSLSTRARCQRAEPRFDFRISLSVSCSSRLFRVGCSVEGVRCCLGSLRSVLDPFGTDPLARGRALLRASTR